MSEIKDTVMADIKACMKSGVKARLGVLRLISSAVKQREVDERVDTDDAAMIAILDKMAKQRRESIEQFTTANRTDLADAEVIELEIIKGYLPAQLSDEEVSALVDKAVADTGASSVRDMGKVMGILKPQLQGRADMSAVSAQIKTRLNA